MKTFITIIGLMLTLSLSAQEQYGYTALGGADGGTYYLAGSGNTNLGGSAIFTATKHDQFTLALSWTPRTSADGQVTVAWEMSPDGTTWPANIAGNTNSSFRSWFIAIGANATNAAGQALFMTNITMNTAGYYKVAAITNASSAILTNLAVRAYYKPRRQGSYP